MKIENRMNPVKISNKQTANKRRRSKTSLSPDKAAKKAIELSQQLDSLIERCGNNESCTEELHNSASINGDPLITSSQTQTTSFSGKNIKKRRVFTKIAEFNSEEECDYHIRTTNRYPTIITHNDPTKCICQQVKKNLKRTSLNSIKHIQRPNRVCMNTVLRGLMAYGQIG